MLTFELCLSAGSSSPAAVIDTLLMSKRKADDEPWTWHPKCKKPKWPSEPEDWTEEDFRSGMSVNAMSLDVKGHEQHAQPPMTATFVKCSRLIQALDLSQMTYQGVSVDFHDFEIQTTDAWTPLPPIVKLWFAVRDVDI